MVCESVGTGKWGKDIFTHIQRNGPDAEGGRDYGSDEEAGHEIADRGSCNRTWRTEYPSDRRSKLHGFRGRSAFSLCVDESRV